MVSWVTGFPTTHLYLPVCSRVRLGRVTLASEKLRREPLWIHWYLGLGLEVALHSIVTWEPILADRTPLKISGLVLSHTLSGPSAETGQETQSYVFYPLGSRLLPSIHTQSSLNGRCPRLAPRAPPRPNTRKAAVPTTRL